VAGHSTGGWVATALAGQRPGLVTALALIDTGPRADAFIPQGFISGLLPVPVIGQLLWRFRTDNLIRQGLSTAFTRKIEIPQQLMDDARGMTYHAYIATSQASHDYLKQRALPDRLKSLGKARAPGTVIRWVSLSAC
jgi:pimeloyl-ACP methyl ester carboxylesterase